MKKIVKKNGSAGRTGAAVRSDCYVRISLLQRGGVTIDLTSKVGSMYGDSIRNQVLQILHHRRVKNASVKIVDHGAFPFVITARVETALERIGVIVSGNSSDAKIRYGAVHSRDRMRRTRLYLPGNEPHYFINASLHKPDCIILDLEDSVAPAEKDTARNLVHHALEHVSFGSAERMVRINPFPLGRDDLNAVVTSNLQTVLVPKCESADQVRIVDEEIDTLLSFRKMKRSIFLIPIIESALGIVHAFEIATASKWNCALAIGLEDYTADLGVERTPEGSESIFARSIVVNAAVAAQIQPLDSVFSDVSDGDGLRRSVLEAKSLGFEGKGCIHPRQIPIIHEALAPTKMEVERAQRIIEAYNDAQQRGSGVVAVGTKMIDAPVVKRAQRILSLAKKVNH